MRPVKREEDNLTKQNQELTDLMNHIPGGVFRIAFDAPLTILYMSDGFLSILGYTREEIENRFHSSFWNLIHHDDREKMLAMVKEQLTHSDTKELQYRIIRGDGSVIWVLDKGQLVRDELGQETFYNFLVDITKQIKDQEELRLSLERHKIIMNQAADIIFEWDIARDTLTFSSNWFKKFGYQPITREVSRLLPRTAHIHPDDRPLFLETFQKIAGGTSYAEVEMRIKNFEGVFLWFKIRATVQFDSAGSPMKAVGVIVDIDQEKKASQNLIYRAERDALTGIYNKETAQSMVKDYLVRNPSGSIDALVILDIDDFKHINDTLGHLSGDAVLTDIAAVLKRLFRASDILGRIGGDEFMIFLKDIPSPRFAMGKGDQVIEAICSLSKGHKESIQTSCSIGISLFPRDGKDFHSLFGCADTALYQAKKQGKNRCVQYQGDFSFPASSTAPRRTQIDSSAQGELLQGYLADYVFRTLYRSDQTNETIHLILEFLGKRLNVSRVYIFEFNQDRTALSNTFEWCNEGVPSELDRLQNVLGGSLDEYYSLFDDSGIFYCKDIRSLPPADYSELASQGIKCMLQCAMKEQGVWQGFLGFDECVCYRYWTQEQIEIISLVADILGTFLLKQRTGEKLKRSERQLRSILDCQESFIYVADSSYRLRYVNRKLSEIMADWKSKRCHQLFFDRDEPCAQCPIQNPEHTEAEFYYPGTSRWALLKSAPILWEGEDCTLFTCTDVTRYHIDKKA